MKSLVLEKTNTITLREMQIKEHLGDTDVRIKPVNVGICGSDVHYYLYGNIGSFIVKEPMVLGHEASGIITEVGKKVQSLKVGDRVCMEPGIPDFNSAMTMAGMYNLDPAVAFWATPPIHGCARESVIHPAALTFKLPDSLSFEEGALVEPTAIGVYAAQKANIRPGDTAVVAGAGTIGIVTALAALASGCSKVIIYDIKQSKLDFITKHYGSTKRLICVNTTRESVKDKIAEQDLYGADIFFEASGSIQAFKNFTDCLRPGGKAVFIGMPAQPVPIDIVAMQVKEISCSTIFRYVNCYPKTIRLIDAGILNVAPLITHRFDFEKGVEAFKFAGTMPEDAVKIMLKLS